MLSHSLFSSSPGTRTVLTPQKTQAGNGHDRFEHREGFQFVTSEWNRRGGWQKAGGLAVCLHLLTFSNVFCWYKQFATVITFIYFPYFSTCPGRRSAGGWWEAPGARQINIGNCPRQEFFLSIYFPYTLVVPCGRLAGDSVPAKKRKYRKNTIWHSNHLVSKCKRPKPHAADPVDKV